MNPFEQKQDWVTLKDDPDGRRVILDCQACLKQVYECKYYPKHKTISWKCECGHISKQELDLGE